MEPFFLLFCLFVNFVCCCCFCTEVIYWFSKDTRTIYNCPKSSSASIRDVYYIKLKVSCTETYSSTWSWNTKYQQFFCCWVGKPCKCFTRSYPDANHPKVKGASWKSKFNCIGESTSSFITNRCDHVSYRNGHKKCSNWSACKESRVR